MGKITTDMPSYASSTSMSEECRGDQHFKESTRAGSPAGENKEESLLRMDATIKAWAQARLLFHPSCPPIRSRTLYEDFQKWDPKTTINFFEFSKRLREIMEEEEWSLEYLPGKFWGGILRVDERSRIITVLDWMKDSLEVVDTPVQGLLGKEMHAHYLDYMHTRCGLPVLSFYTRFIKEVEACANKIGGTYVWRVRKDKQGSAGLINCVFRGAKKDSIALMHAWIQAHLRGNLPPECVSTTQELYDDLASFAKKEGVVPPARSFFVFHMRKIAHGMGGAFITQSKWGDRCSVFTGMLLRSAPVRSMPSVAEWVKKEIAFDAAISLPFYEMYQTYLEAAPSSGVSPWAFKEEVTEAASQMGEYVKYVQFHEYTPRKVIFRGCTWKNTDRRVEHFQPCELWISEIGKGIPVIEAVRIWAKEWLFVHQSFTDPVPSRDLYKDFEGKERGVQLKEFVRLLRTISEQEGWDVRYLKKGWIGFFLKKSESDRLVTVEEWAKDTLEVRTNRVGGVFIEEMYTHYVDYIKEHSGVPVLSRGQFTKRMGAYLRVFGGVYRHGMSRNGEVGAGYVNCAFRVDMDDPYDLLRAWIREELELGEDKTRATRLDELHVRYQQFLRSEKKEHRFPSQKMFSRHLRQVVAEMRKGDVWEERPGMASVVYRKQDK